MSYYLKLREHRKCGNLRGIRGILMMPLLSSKLKKSPQVVTKERSQGQRSNLNLGQTCLNKITNPRLKRLGTRSWTTAKAIKSNSSQRPTIQTTCSLSRWEINPKIWRSSTLKTSTKMIWTQIAGERCQTGTKLTICNSSNKCNIKLMTRWSMVKNRLQGNRAMPSSEESQCQDLKLNQLTRRNNQH